MAVLDSVLCEGPVNSRVSNGKLIIDQEINYRVIAATVDEDRISILQTTTGLPVAQVDDRGGLRCRSVRLQPVREHRLHYIATALFSSEVTENTDPATPKIGDPVDWVPQAEVEFEPYEQVVAKDVNGKPWLNSAGRPFETGLILPRRLSSRVFIQFEKVAPVAQAWQPLTSYARHRYVTNDSGKIYQCKTAGTSGGTLTPGPTGTATNITEGTVVWDYVPVESGSVNLDQIEERCDKLNSVTFRGRPANTLLLEVRRAAIGTYYGYRRWRVEYAMKYKEETWTIEQLNMGWEYKNAAGKLVKFKDQDGSYFLGKLASNGTALSDQIADDPTYEEFEGYKTIDFNTFLAVQ